MTHFKPSIKKPFLNPRRTKRWAVKVLLIAESMRVTWCLGTPWEGRGPHMRLGGAGGAGGRASLMKPNAICYVHVRFSGEGVHCFLSAFRKDLWLPESTRNPRACITFGLRPSGGEGTEVHPGQHWPPAGDTEQGTVPSRPSASAHGIALPDVSRAQGDKHMSEFEL